MSMTLLLSRADGAGYKQCPPSNGGRFGKKYIGVKNFESEVSPRLELQLEEKRDWVAFVATSISPERPRCHTSEASSAEHHNPLPNLVGHDL